ncbi:Tyrosine-protein phosphatase 1 [Folsomia candida]|uniref:protein-tyrosine-phosphatase n=1 Tax=Folsomia candida TaxID=158441 RepID=A0A226EID7_FOLCA|nr:Tyrosine-protein phosphatase 1 [Folsomia candida]
MFEKSRKSFISGARGTYRVRDSSLDATPSSTTNNNLNAISNAAGPPTTSKASISSSTYRISRSRSSRAKRLSITVIFLDDSQHTFEVEKSARGSVLLDKVFQHLELIERDYFGLTYDELLPPPEVIHPLSSPHLRWVEASKPLKKQIRFTKPSQKKSSFESSNGDFRRKSGSKLRDYSSTSSISSCATVYFRVKFFVEDPSKLHEEYTRYHVYLQIRKDINENRLLVSPSTGCVLASYAAQSEIGDFENELHDHEGLYLRRLNLRINGPHIEDVYRKICEIHQLHHGQTPADAEFNYLDQVKKLDAYGVNFHRVMDNAGKDLELGISSDGIRVYHSGLKINTFCWSKITKIAFKRKQFFIQLRRELSEDYDTLLLFECFSYRSCKALWKCCVENHAFFRLRSPPPVHVPTLALFGFGSRFHYTGKTEYQTREDASKSVSRTRRTFFRSQSKRVVVSKQVTPVLDSRRTIQSSEEVDMITNGDCNKENSSHWDGNNSQMKYPMNDKNEHNNALETYGIVSLKESKIDAWTNKNGGNGVYRNTNGALSDRLKLTLPLDSSSRTGVSARHQEQPRMAWAEQHLSDDEGGFVEPVSSQQVQLCNGGKLMGSSTAQVAAIVLNAAAAISTPHISKGIAFMDDDENSISDDGIVTIRLEPDAHDGKFGFNVKGGFDMGCPILVSRVAPGTPADQCYPRLNEADQIIQINGRETAGMIHADVVSAIRSAASVKKELVLRVKQNVYTTDDYEEPPFRYVPEVPLLQMPSQRGNGSESIQSPLTASMLLLAEAIETDISNQFDLLTRRKPELTCDAAKDQENSSKNRYRDILPYDKTRVLLINSPGGGDYINANFISMEVPSSGVVNRYIAAQGPLSTTTGDFWIMTWESQSPLIVMLTSLNERGRSKCFQYWPDQTNNPVTHHNIQVTLVQTKSSRQWIQREFTIKHLQTKEERSVIQLQYESWPDHGTPSDKNSFIRFMDKVRQVRSGSFDPVIVHCSAGIGRTGVLILMETAECLIEANQPVYPLDIVNRMREQRPLMIQTSSQYQFVQLVLTL